MSAPVVVPRNQWIRQTWKPIARIPTPTRENWVHHSGPGTKNFATLLGNERYHVVTLGWRGLGYSWAITANRIDRGFARIYESRGWGVQGGHTRGRNTLSHGFLLVGDWTAATRAEIEAAAKSLAWLIDDGARRGFTTRSITGGHRQAPGAATTCPGTAGMAVVRRGRELLAAPKPAPPKPEPEPEEDEMNPEQDARLRRVEEAVNDLAGLVNSVVDGQIGGRNVGSDLQRLRLSQRAIGTRVGAPVDNNGPLDGSTVVS